MPRRIRREKDIYETSRLDIKKIMKSLENDRRNRENQQRTNLENNTEKDRN